MAMGVGETNQVEHSEEKKETRWDLGENQHLKDG